VWLHDTVHDRTDGVTVLGPFARSVNRLHSRRLRAAENTAYKTGHQEILPHLLTIVITKTSGQFPKRWLIRPRLVL
jgi:hypothetical protein